MFDELWDKLLNFFTSRLTILTIVFLALGGILAYRCFDLQIVKGQEYLDNFMVQTEKTRDISSTRGNIYDCDGNLLAYNELAYSVKIEDVYESGSKKNQNLNATIYKLIKMIEKNGDSVVTDLKIYINEDGEFDFTVDGNSRLRFLADVYGYASVSKLSDEEKTKTALEVMQYLSRYKGFAIGELEDPKSSASFVPGQGYSMEDWLKMVTIRYDMSLTAYRKYIGTTVATAVNEKTVAVIMENSGDLLGVSIEEDTVRRYVDSFYFAHVLGYTGKISSDELTTLNDKLTEEGNLSEKYTISDVVGKKGIESYMETTLQGSKGYERVIVDNTGKVRTIVERKEAVAGQDVYLTINKDLTIATYNIVEQKLAGLVSSKIINAKEYKPTENSKSSDIKIPIYDVYFALINNSVIDHKHFASEDAGEVEAQVYLKYLDYKEGVYSKLNDELYTKKTVYKKLKTEYQVYESNIIALLKKNGVIMTEAIDANDATQIAWATDETISMSEYLRYCISMNWIDTSKLDLEGKYADSDEIFNRIVDVIFASVEKNNDFQKKLYKYMLLSDVISGKDICKILCEQEACEIPIEEEEALYKGKLSAYQFMMNRITNIDITPAQLALDPCNASVVIVDVNTGDVKAMVSYPGYDNNKMANSVDAVYYAKLTTDKASPEYNFATQYKAAPGSTFKIVSATAGLMEGVINLKTKVNCIGTFTEINPSPRCWKTSGHGIETVSTAIRDSCNYFFYNVGYMLSTRTGTYDAEAGLDTLYKYADMYGLSDKSGVEISEESPEVSNTDPVRSAIGQGSNSYSTAQLARYAATIANGGTNYNLTLLDKVCLSNGELVEEFEPEIRNTIEMPESYWSAIHEGMRAVVKNKTYFSDLAVNVAGKTGTAEQTSSRPNHALFICYAPYEEPELAIATRIPFGYSSDYAAQTTRDIIKYYYGLAEEEELINGIADTPDAGVNANEM